MFPPNYQSGEQFNPSGDLGGCEDKVDDGEDEEFFSPRGSSARKDSPTRIGTGSSSRREFQGIGGVNFGSRSFNSRTASYPYSNSCSPANSISTNASTSPGSLKSKSPDSVVNFFKPENQSPVSISPSSSSSGHTQDSRERISSFPWQTKQTPGRNERVSNQFVPKKLPPPPPPPPPPKFWEIPVASRTANELGPPLFVMPSKSVVFPNSELKENGSLEQNEEILKPKLKPLHWDKVRASSDRAMVWDQIKASSFQ